MKNGPIKENKTTAKSQAKFDPNEGIEQVPYPRHLVEAIDKIIEMKRDLGVPDHVEGDNAWKVFDFIYEVWKTLYPDNYLEFVQTQQETWANLKNDYAASDREGEAQIRKVVEIPEKLFQMVMTTFPNQKWDKPFLTKLAKRIPLLRASKKS